MAKRILMILQSEFPPDVRIEKEGRTLLQHGYEIHLLCNKFKESGDVRELINGIHIHRISVVSKSNKVNKLLNMPFPGNYRWYNFIKEKIGEIKPDIIHVHDLPLMMTGIKLGRKFNIPVIFDRHEDYPEALRMWKQSGIVAKTIKHPAVVQQIERYSVRNADHILVVIDEAKEKLEKMGISGEKISVVSNTVVETDYIESPYQKNENAITIVYTGTFSPSRGLETAIEGMVHVKSDLPESRLVLVGDGADKSVKENLEELARNLNLEKDIIFTGWATRDVMWDYIRKASVCIVPQPSHPFTNNTIPHKLFEYMLYGKPVVVSDAKPLKRIVGENNCGTVFKSRSPESFAQAVIDCYRNKENFGLNGKNAVKNKYNWETDGKTLIHAYENLLKNVN